MTTIDQRMLATAVVDRIIYGAPDSFEAEDARTLHGLLPRPSVWRRLASALPRIQVRHATSGAGLEGVAAGVGGVAMPGGTSIAEIDLDGRICIRAGQWRIYQSGGLLDALRGIDRVEIVQVASEARIEGAQAILVFRRGEPVELLGWKERPVIGTVLQVATPAPWKRPRPGSG